MAQVAEVGPELLDLSASKPKHWDYGLVSPDPSKLSQCFKNLLVDVFYILSCVYSWAFESYFECNCFHDFSLSLFYKYMEMLLIALC